MKILMSTALAITLLGGTAAFAQDHSGMDNGQMQQHDQNNNQDQNRGDQNRGNDNHNMGSGDNRDMNGGWHHHHRHQICTWHHHHRHCYWG